MPKKSEIARTGISFSDASLLKAAKEKASQDGFRSLSAYIESLIRADVSEPKVDPEMLRAIVAEVDREMARKAKSKR